MSDFKRGNPSRDNAEQSKNQARSAEGLRNTLEARQATDQARQHAPPQDSTGRQDMSVQDKSAGPNLHSERTQDKRSHEAGRRNEAAERQSVAQPEQGMGFRFNEDKPARGEPERWWNNLTSDQRAALRNPDATVVITALASGPGSNADNQALSERRADNTASILKERFGVQAKFKVEAVGEQNATNSEHDNRNDRVAFIDIIAPGKVLPEVANLIVHASKDLSKMPDRLPEYNLLKELKDRLLDGPPGETAIFKEVAKLTGKLFEGLGQLRLANERMMTLIGVKYSLNIIERDARLSNNRHILEGQTYTPTELRERTRTHWGGEIANEAYRGSYLVLNSDGLTTDVNRGIDGVANAANAVLGASRTPADRQIALRSLVRAVDTRIIQEQAQLTRDVLESKRNR